MTFNLEEYDEQGSQYEQRLRHPLSIPETKKNEKTKKILNFKLQGQGNAHYKE